MTAPHTPDPARGRGHTGRLLVVDDEERNRRLLRDLLTAQGHRVSTAADGEEALAEVAANPPDAVLSNVLMPGIDGFTLCRQLKDDVRSAHIPVLLVTALTDREARLRGIDAGAIDFISKPIDGQEVVLRVRNAVAAKHLYDEVSDNYRHLRELEGLRDNLTDLIVHDMKNPLYAVSGYLQLMRDGVNTRLDEAGKRYTLGALNTMRFLVELVQSLLDVGRMEAGKLPVTLAACNVGGLVTTVVGDCGSLLQSKDLKLLWEPVTAPAVCDAGLVSRVVWNLIGNAIKFSTSHSEIRLAVAAAGQEVRLTVEDQGPGIPPSYHQRIFEKYGRVKEQKEGKMYSTGLGLTFCRLAVEANKGRIGVESPIGQAGTPLEGHGSRFWFTLPAC